MNYIGIDAGTSATKIIEYHDGKIINKHITLEKDIQIVLDYFLKNYHIDIHNIEKIVLTGIRADKFKSAVYQEKLEKVDEFTAIGMGGLCQTEKTNILVASIGTGTAFVRCHHHDFNHLGGTGVGGGTFLQLAEKITGISSFEEILEKSQRGTLKNVDLQIGDITNAHIPNLAKEVTVSNFGKMNPEASDADILLGLANMVFETVGVMASFLAKACGAEEIVVIGSMAVHPWLKRVLAGVSMLHNIKFVIPENPEFLCAVGAIENCQNN